MNMHAFLLINFDPQDFAKKQNAKVIPFTLQKIEDARELKKFVKFSFFEKTAIVIENIDNVTPEAANAFLKNLEEPNSNMIYILTASNLNNVLPTIISRCQIVKVNSEPSTEYGQDIKKFTEMNTNTKLEYISKIKDRLEAVKFVEDLTHYFHNQVLTDHSSPFTVHLQLCLETIAALRANGNVSLQMTNLVARMNSDGKTTRI